ncbi:MAG: helix-turn-helix transcriptional regulator, partial [Lachnospiraceae bacterium]|nr:helix-turn-helix transcriptional regulator [Lachnospiraceae bacterium]
MYNSQDLAIRIKSVAKERKKIIKDMLVELELGSNTMSAMYHGKSIAFDSLAKMADYLGCSVDYLLGRTNMPQIYSNNVIHTGDI